MAERFHVMDDLSRARARRLGQRVPAEPGLSDSERKGIRLGTMIQDVSRIRRSAYDRYMKPLGVTRAQWSVLAQLSRQDGLVQAKLADMMGIGRASVGSLIINLEANGLIARHPDPIDQRAKRVYLTRSARDLIKRMKKHEIEFNEQTLIDLTPDERKVLFKSLIKIKNALARFAADDFKTRERPGLSD